ncbi:three component ABC system middle component [Snodgrassella alvi]|uniref:three component ABC system middle component n=1 Tax=Snodgrassella alvi TaxID=1196083 RepID=UPI00352E5573
MNISYYIYNNEAISTAVLMSVITKLKRINVALAPLVLPFLLDNRIVNHLLKDEANYENIEQFIQSKRLYFTSFNNRFLSLLPVTVNALMILQKSNVINITDTISIKKEFEFDVNELGLRFTKIENAIPKFVALIKDYSLSDLYIKFKIQL